MIALTWTSNALAENAALSDDPRCMRAANAPQDAVAADKELECLTIHTKRLA